METTLNINAGEGYAIINRANGFIKMFVIETELKKRRDAYFKQIFRADLWKHLAGKYDGKEFGSFYLNIDNDCQKRLLNFLFQGYSIDLNFPDIPEWEAIGVKRGLTLGEFDQEDVRRIAVMFKDKTKWEIMPHSMVWLHKWVLYANNNGIDGHEFDEETKEVFKNYPGDRYGTWTNWAKFWDWCPRGTREKIIDKLVDY